MQRNAGIIQKLKVIYPTGQIMKRTHYIYKLPWPGNVTFRICCGSWRGGGGSGGYILVQAYIFTQACSFLQPFRHNLPKMNPGPKNGLERRVSQFHTICDKNQLLNINIEKVMAFLVLRSWDSVPLGQVAPRGPMPAVEWSCIWRTPADRELKMSCIDASRRQLQSVLKIRV